MQLDTIRNHVRNKKVEPKKLYNALGQYMGYIDTAMAAAIVQNRPRKAISTDILNCWPAFDVDNFVYGDPVKTDEDYEGESGTPFIAMESPYMFGEYLVVARLNEFSEMRDELPDTKVKIFVLTDEESRRVFKLNKNSTRNIDGSDDD